MKPRDILDEIGSGAISGDQAQQILDAVLDSPEAALVESTLGFSRVEWTAQAHGANLSELAQWRKEGWPRQCQLCGREINIEKFGWRVIDVEGESRLKHIQCP